MATPSCAKSMCLIRLQRCAPGPALPCWAPEIAVARASMKHTYLERLPSGRAGPCSGQLESLHSVLPLTVQPGTLFSFTGKADARDMQEICISSCKRCLAGSVGFRLCSAVCKLSPACLLLVPPCQDLPPSGEYYLSPSRRTSVPRIS